VTCSVEKIYGGNATCKEYYSKRGNNPDDDAFIVETRRHPPRLFVSRCVSLVLLA
jgi:hypothetical protein